MFYDVPGGIIERQPLFNVSKVANSPALRHRLRPIPSPIKTPATFPHSKN